MRRRMGMLVLALLVSAACGAAPRAYPPGLVTVGEGSDVPLFRPVSGGLPPLGDSADLFGKGEGERIKEAMRALAKSAKVSVRIETLAALEKEDQRRCDAEGREKFLARLMQEKFDRAPWYGLAILVIRKPLSVHVHFRKHEPARRYDAAFRRALAERLLFRLHDGQAAEGVLEALVALADPATKDGPLSEDERRRLKALADAKKLPAGKRLEIDPDEIEVVPPKGMKAPPPLSAAETKWLREMLDAEKDAAERRALEAEFKAESHIARHAMYQLFRKMQEGSGGKKPRPPEAKKETFRPLSAAEGRWLKEILEAEKDTEARKSLELEFRGETHAGRKGMYDLFRKAAKAPPEVKPAVPDPKTVKGTPLTDEEKAWLKEILESEKDAEGRKEIEAEYRAESPAFRKAIYDLFVRSKKKGK